jgi:hypothetical protein
MKGKIMALEAYIQHSVDENVYAMCTCGGTSTEELLFGTPACSYTLFLIKFAEIPLISTGQLIELPIATLSCQ